MGPHLHKPHLAQGGGHSHLWRVFRFTNSRALPELVRQGETEIDKQEKTTNYLNEPIEVYFEKVSENKLFVKSFGFNSYLNAKEMISSLEDEFKTTIQNEGKSYSILFGPLENKEANNLFSTLIFKGYKNTEIIIE